MNNKNFYTIKNLIKSNKLDDKDFAKIVESYNELGLSISQLRLLLRVFKTKVLEKIGILGRGTDEVIKAQLEKDFDVKNLIVKTQNLASQQKEFIDQSLQIGDMVYEFSLKDKLAKILK